MWAGLLDRRFTLLEAPSAWTGDLALELAHAALRGGPARVLVYDGGHCIHPDTFARLNRRAGLEPTDGARRTFVQRAITPFQWDTLLSKHLDRMLAAHSHEAVILAPYDRLFSTDELAKWERIDHLEFSLERLAQRSTQAPILAIGDLDRLAASQPELATRMRAGVHRRVKVLRERGVWRLVHLAGAPLADSPMDPQMAYNRNPEGAAFLLHSRPSPSDGDSDRLMLQDLEYRRAQRAQKGVSLTPFLGWRPGAAICDQIEGPTSDEDAHAHDAHAHAHDVDGGRRLNRARGTERDTCVPGQDKSSAPSAKSAASWLSESVRPTPTTSEVSACVQGSPMGMSQPTVSRQVDAFASEFRLFRSNLPRSEQAWFDTLVAWTRRHGNALNVSEDLDFTRRVLLVGLLSIADHLESRLSVLETANGIIPTVPATLRPVQPIPPGFADPAGQRSLPIRLLPERQPQPAPAVDEARPVGVAA